MSNEHNPVALLVGKIQQKWLTEVSPYNHIQYVRWCIKPDEARLYEGFLRLESSENGSIPDMPLVLLTPFEDSKEHSKSLIRDWIRSFEKDEKLQQRITEKSIEFKWDKNHFQKKLEEKNIDFNLLLIELLEAFQKALPETQQFLTLSLFPYTVSAPKDYLKWMDDMLRLGLPPKTRLMVFDHRPENYFESIQINHKKVAKSLYVELDIDAAMKKIALTGDPNDPEVQFRECIIEMGNSAAKNNRKRLHSWGEKGLEVTQKTANKASFATAHAVYAGMLFQFKEFDTIDKLLHRGLTIAKQGEAMGDDTCNAIILQLHGYMAASAHHQKETDKATDLFCKQAELAASFGLGQQALATYITAYTLIKKKNATRYQALLKQSFDYGRTLPKEQLASSGMTQIAWDYYHECNSTVQRSINDFMNALEGTDWKEKMELQERNLQTGISIP